MSKYCPRCGRQLDDTDCFCGYCGNVLDAAPAYQPSVSPEPIEYSPAGSRKKGLIIGLSISAVVVITTVILLFVFLGGGVKSLTKKCFDSFQAGDYRTFYKYSLDAYYSDQSEIDKKIEKAKEKDLCKEYKKYKLTVLKEIPIKGKDLEELKNSASDIYSDDFPVWDIQAVSLVSCKISYEDYDGEQVFFFDEICWVKIKGKWYYEYFPYIHG